MATILPPPAHTKDDLLGVCSALGDVTGLSPLLFRLGFVLALLAASFEATLIVYCVAGLAVQIARRFPGAAQEKVER